jgi:hypothetical protein
MGKAGQKPPQPHEDDKHGKLPGPSKLDELLTGGSPLRGVEKDHLAAITEGAGKNSKEILTFTSDIDPGQFLKGVERVGELRKHPTVTPLPEISLDIPGSDLDRFDERVDIGNRTNGIGWVLSKPGKTEFVKPKFTDSHEFCGQHFDETEVIEKCRSEGYDTVYMTISFEPTIGNFREMRLSQEKIRKAVGRDVEVRLLSVTGHSPHLGKATAYILNPDVDTGEVDSIQDSAEKLQRDSYNRIQAVVAHLANKSAVMFAARHGDKEELTRRLTPEIVKSMKDFMVLAFGDEQAAEAHYQSLMGNERAFSKSVKGKTLSPMFVYSIHNIEQLAFRKFLLDTNVVRPVEVSNLYQGLIGLNEQARQSIPAAKVLGEGHMVDDDVWKTFIWPLALATPPLGETAAVLRPLAVAHIEGSIVPAQSTLNAISDNVDVINKCVENRPDDYPDFEKHVSITIARGRMREKLVKESSKPAAADMDHPSAVFKAVFDDSSLPEPIKQRLKERVEAATEHTLEDLLSSNELKNIHDMPIIEAVESGLRAEKAGAEETIKANSQTIALKNKELAQMFAKGSKKQRAKFNPDALRNRLRSENARSAALIAEIDGICDDLVLGENTGTVLKRLSELKETRLRDLTEGARRWVGLRARLDDVPVVDLLPAKSAELENAVMAPARDIELEHADRDLAFTGAVELVKDISAFYGSEDRPQATKDVSAYMQLQLREWKTRKPTLEDLPRLARELVFAKNALGRPSSEYMAFQKFVGENVSDRLFEDYLAIESAYERVAELRVKSGKARVWVEARAGLEKLPPTDLFGGAMGTAIEVYKPARNVEVPSVNKQEIFDQGKELVKDVVAVLRSENQVEVLEGISAQAGIMHTRWVNTDVTPQDFPQLARESVLLKTVLSGESPAITAHQKMVAEKITDGKQLEGYKTIEAAYEKAAQKAVEKL